MYGFVEQQTLAIMLIVKCSFNAILVSFHFIIVYMAIASGTVRTLLGLPTWLYYLSYVIIYRYTGAFLFENEFHRDSFPLLPANSNFTGTATCTEDDIGLKLGCRYSNGTDFLQMSPLSHIKTIGFIGGGKMASALATGFLKAGLFQPSDISTSQPSPFGNEMWEFWDSIGCFKSRDNGDILPRSDVIILATKPQQIKEVCKELDLKVEKKDLRTQYFISIAAGIPLSTLQEGMGQMHRKIPAVRIMANVACQEMKTATSFCITKGFDKDEEHSRTIQGLFEPLGTAAEEKYHFPSPNQSLDDLNLYLNFGLGFAFYVGMIIVNLLIYSVPLPAFLKTKFRD
ncbi:unnamed protein product [Cyprideis torosa]|uniref:Uncharacterized protein n=1 Tax=Cyprideis torosa TaxID=163714 RepID=A0A7R8ZKB3_9CRUS|nr:unnamed protein product [Cyprideis torosa]CAG0884111.1 unnamed protein product [Cyprideis torosa]